MINYFIDTETVGFHAIPVLLQYAEDDTEIKLYNLWKEPIEQTLELIEEIVNNTIIGFNLSFDWFHLSKIYNLLYGFSGIPEDQISEIAAQEKESRYKICLKPKSALDLMLHARKGPYQNLMARSDIKIKKVPTLLAFELAEELERRVHLDDVFFSRRKNKYAPQWAIRETDSPDFKDVVLKFAASGGLKALASHALGIDATSFKEIQVDNCWLPETKGWSPLGGWSHVLKYHIDHWAYNNLARKYATDDVDYTRQLYEHFGRPEAGDDDSVLACMVGAVRWYGFAVDIPKIKKQRELAANRISSIPMAPRQVLAYIGETLSPAEKLTMKGTTKRVVLEEIRDQFKCDCYYDGKQGCELCNDTGRHLASIRAEEVLGARKAKKHIENYDKIIEAGRFHASFKVIGTLSSRMSGSDGLNAQGIPRTKEVRSCFTLADDGFVLCGGDFDAFEISIAAAHYNDDKLTAQLKTGKKLHALYAMEMFPNSTYDEIINDGEKYTKGKNGVFTMIYGGDFNTLVNKYGVNEEAAKKAERNFFLRYPKVKEARKQVFNAFCSMQQPGGLGTRVIWNEPADYIESLTGFRRYFILENQICKALFELAQKPPRHWKDIKIKVTRRAERGTQYVGGATQSALFASAFGIQGSAMRAAANHVIQSTGAVITKRVQRKIWDLQPCGANPWRVLPMNIHDEIMCAVRPSYTDKVKQIVDETVESFRNIIPLISMKWKSNIANWGDK